MMLRALTCDLLDQLLPATCPVCRRPLRRGETVLCDNCLSVAFAAVPPPRFDLPELRRVDSTCYWSSESRALVGGFKYGFRPLMIRHLSGLIAEQMTLDRTRIDLLLPVPLHHTRMRQRGYNQSELLGRLLAEMLDLPLETGNLIRRRNTGTQTRLSGSERRRNVAGAFRLRRPDRIRGKSVLLIDDVVTTGATLVEIARLLPAREVRAWTLVRRLVER